MVSISKKYKFVYIAAPKTASTSISNCLEKFTDEPDFFHHATALETKAYLKEKGLYWTDFHSFSTVRNPWSRLVSAYNHAQMEGTETELWRKHLKDMKESLSTSIYYKKLVDRAEEQMHPIIKRSWKQYLVDFKTWVKRFSDMEQYHYDYMYCDNDGKCMVNQFIKVEELNHEFPKLMEKLGIDDWELPILNVKPHESYQEYYNEETKQIVAEIYKKQIEMFDYALF